MVLTLQLLNVPRNYNIYWIPKWNTLACSPKLTVLTAQPNCNLRKHMQIDKTKGKWRKHLQYDNKALQPKKTHANGQRTSHLRKHHQFENNANSRPIKETHHNYVHTKQQWNCLPWHLTVTNITGQACGGCHALKLHNLSRLSVSGVGSVVYS